MINDIGHTAPFTVMFLSEHKRNMSFAGTEPAMKGVELKNIEYNEVNDFGAVPL